MTISSKGARSKTSKSTKGCGVRKGKIAIKSIENWTVSHDDEIVKRALETCNLTSLRMWSQLRKDRYDLFSNISVGHICKRVFQLAAGLGNEKKFNSENRENLKKLLDIVPGKKQETFYRQNIRTEEARGGKGGGGGGRGGGG
ncbi:hypothetical protein RF55_13994 [Lasius niger]|uniref:Uncharacterized protein n=1 Tax=Lasius niger TaxID=67767 RepID=A0A0J7K8Z8_LASNI|nr:hypothetical protein RF55_13994 [Lasius niger]